MIEIPLEELIRRMIVRSSNLATNLLIERIGAPTVMDLMRRIEAYDLRVLRGVEDQKAYDAGMNNVTTANDLRIVLKAIADGTTFSPATSERMIDILKAQEFNEKIPAGLPPGTPVAHKTGDISGIHHDAAIVFPPGEKPYVLVVLTAGFEDEKEAAVTHMTQDHRERIVAIDGDPHRTGNHRRHDCRIFQHREVHESDIAAEVGNVPMRNFHRERCLAHPCRTDDREQGRPGNPLAEQFHIALAPDQMRLRRQIG